MKHRLEFLVFVVETETILRESDFMDFLLVVSCGEEWLVHPMWEGISRRVTELGDEGADFRTTFNEVV